MQAYTCRYRHLYVDTCIAYTGRCFSLISRFLELSICIYFSNGSPAIASYLSNQSCSSSIHLPPWPLPVRSCSKLRCGGGWGYPKHIAAAMVSNRSAPLLILPFSAVSGSSCHSEIEGPSVVSGLQLCNFFHQSLKVTILSAIFRKIRSPFQLIKSTVNKKAVRSVKTDTNGFTTRKSNFFHSGHSWHPMKKIKSAFFYAWTRRIQLIGVSAAI